MAGYATSTGNRTTNDGTWTYTFDDAGNEIKKSQGAGAETWNYLYDSRNQLIAAKQHATDGGTLLAKVQYKYDALGDRIERGEDAERQTDVIYSLEPARRGHSGTAPIAGVAYREEQGAGKESACFLIAV